MWPGPPRPERPRRRRNFFGLLGLTSIELPPNKLQMWRHKLGEWVQWVGATTPGLSKLTYHPSVGQHHTCLEAARVAYGIPTCTMNRMLALLRKDGPGALSVAKSLSQWDRDARSAEVRACYALAVRVQRTHAGVVRGPVASGVRRQILILSCPLQAMRRRSRCWSRRRRPVRAAQNIKLIELSRCSCATSTSQAQS